VAPLTLGVSHILPKPTVATGDIYLFGIELPLDEAICFKDPEFIANHSDKLWSVAQGE
jgi:hypothetical protein